MEAATINVDRDTVMDAHSFRTWPTPATIGPGCATGQRISQPRRELSSIGAVRDGGCGGGPRGTASADGRELRWIGTSTRVAPTR